MPYAFYDDTIGMVGPSSLDVDLVGPGPGPTSTGAFFGRMNFYNEELRAYDPVFGAVTLIYAKATATTALGTVCEFTPALSSGVLSQSATAWVGTANSGRPIGVALNAMVAGQFGWFVVQGNAIVVSQGSPAAGNPVYWQAAGIVSPTLVAGKQLVNAVFATAPSVTLGSGTGATTLTSTQALVTLNRPFAQGNIT